MNKNEEVVELLKSLLSAVEDVSKAATISITDMIEDKTPLNTDVIRLIRLKHACVIFSTALKVWLDGENTNFKTVNTHEN